MSSLPPSLDIMHFETIRPNQFILFLGGGGGGSLASNWTRAAVLQISLF